MSDKRAVLPPLAMHAAETPAPALAAFEGYGIELELMLVDEETLSVLPLADRVLTESGKPVGALTRGALGWSNELVLHVIEVKNLRPSPSLAALPDAFQGEIIEIERRLAPFGARLMPGAMHPWMAPRSETKLWPHDNHAIYQAYDRIFDCRSHGWANLQSMHINLPFADDTQFARLHAAVRLVLPLLPALAASSPIAEAHNTGWTDYRMQVYCENARNFPAITGRVIPETITTRAAYEARILAPIYRAIAPHDPDHVLRYEWLNSRGAIARFDRNAIEIRVVDTQECPQADLAIAAAAIAAVRLLYESDTLAAQQEIPTAMLADTLHACMRDAELALIENCAYLQLLGAAGAPCRAGELWQQLIARMPEVDVDAARWQPALKILLEQGPLARRILRAVDCDFSRARLKTVYRALCECLRAGRQFEPACIA